MKLYFVGAGKMATALAAGIIRQGLYKPSELCASDVNEQARCAFKVATGVECEPKADSIKEAEIILLAVKPQVAENVIASLGELRKDCLIISICAGIPIVKLMQWFGTDRVIRVMPNTPLMVGAGASCYALGPGADMSSGKIAEKILGSLGYVRQVAEEQLDAVTALSGSGPAYFFEMIAALSVAGKNAGLDETLSLELSVQTMYGAAQMLLKKMGTPDSLRDAVTSPHGTTAAGLEIMKNGDFRNMMEQVVQAAKNRSIELGK